MKVYQSSKNNASLNSFILQFQLSLEFSQINEILSTYSEALLFLTEYSFLFEMFLKETPSLKNTHTKFKSSFSSPAPARDGWNWWGYCAGNPVMFTDSTGLLDMRTSANGIDFITSYEGGFMANIYDAQNPSRTYIAGEEGDWTIGFGHKLTAEELSNGTYNNGITEETAKSLFASDLSWFE